MLDDIGGRVRWWALSAKPWHFQSSRSGFSLWSGPG